VLARRLAKEVNRMYDSKMGTVKEMKLLLSLRGMEFLVAEARIDG